MGSTPLVFGGALVVALLMFEVSANARPSSNDINSDIQHEKQQVGRQQVSSFSYAIGQ
jgi:hypothetical protein